MKTEQQLRLQCTPDIIKRMVELAEGFELVDSNDKKYKQILFDNKNHYIFHSSVFPLLIHRAVEGWNKKNDLKIRIFDEEIHTKKKFDHFAIGFYQFKDYQPQSLTQCECAMLHCLIDIFNDGQ